MAVYYKSINCNALTLTASCRGFVVQLVSTVDKILTDTAHRAVRLRQLLVLLTTLRGVSTLQLIVQPWLYRRLRSLNGLVAAAINPALVSAVLPPVSSQIAEPPDLQPWYIAFAWVMTIVRCQGIVQSVS